MGNFTFYFKNPFFFNKKIFSMNKKNIIIINNLLKKTLKKNKIFMDKKE
jgi:hypothetical protein